MFPALFTAGMAFVDTADGAVMVGAYGWAFVNPMRKLWYNLTITAASVVVAVLIGGLELLGLVADRLGLEGGFWGLVGDLNADLADFGFLVIGTFVLCWGVRPCLSPAADRRNRGGSHALLKLRPRLSPAPRRPRPLPSGTRRRRP